MTIEIGVEAAGGQLEEVLLALVKEEASTGQSRRVRSSSTSPRHRSLQVRLEAPRRAQTTPRNMTKGREGSQRNRPHTSPSTE